MPAVRDPLPHYMLMLDRVRRRAADFDIIHFHIDYLHFPLFRQVAARTLTTLHGRLDLPDLAVAVSRHSQSIPLVSISDDQRRPLPDWNWQATVHHGLPRACSRSRRAPQGGYLAFLGRICPEKRPDHAIEIARRAGMPLKIAAKVDRVDQAYFDEVIRPAAAATRRSSSWARSASPTKAHSWASAARSCFRSTGPSRSGW